MKNAANRTPDKSIIGVTYGKLTAIKEVDKKSGRRTFLCQCECGRKTETMLHNLTGGRARSCGCFKDVKTHKLAKTPLYKKWKSIKSRCFNKKTNNYHNYGGRGISMYEKWINDPAAFISYIEKNLGQKPKGCSLDRIDNNKNYQPSNLKWSTTKEQMNNTRVNKNIKHKGRTQTITEWAKETGISESTLRYRVDAKWEKEKIFSKPKQNKVMLTYENETLNRSQWARKLNIDPKTLSYRIKKGWPKSKIFQKNNQ